MDSFRKLPGIGERSAQRLAFYVLGMPESEIQRMAANLVSAKRDIHFCKTCFNISSLELCHICSDAERDTSRLCIVSEPKDIFAIEKTTAYKGLYHVLGGVISPLDGIHPESLRIQELIARLKNQVFIELLFAISPTVEGDTTMMYVTSLIKPYQVEMTKLAYGLPIGSHIDYADEMTLSKAINSRIAIK
jgi:recombination protein RecR